MARKVIAVPHEPVYRNNRMVGYYTHTYSVEQPDPSTTPQGPTPRRLQTASLAPRPSTAPAPTPAPPVVTLTAQEFSRLCVMATMVGVPPPPDVWAEVQRRAQAQRGQDGL